MKRTTPTYPLVSMIITTKNSSRTLKKLLDSIKSQSYERIETIVVDNNSTDDTLKIAGQSTKKVYTKGPERSVQRNFGAGKASGSYLFFLDSDMVLTKNVVKESVALIRNGRSVGGVIVPERSIGQGFWSEVKALERKINEGQDYFEAARFFPKKIFSQEGGYDTSLTGPEDWELPQRVCQAYKLLRTESYIIHDEGRLSLLGLVRKKYYYGLSLHRYLSKHRMPVLNPRTVYFLRPAFYKNARELFVHPVLYPAMWLMLMIETIGGALGYMVGRFRYEK